jgi:hypothetical protein
LTFFHVSVPLSNAADFRSDEGDISGLLAALGIVWHWEQATRGMRWYADAHRVACDIAHGGTHLGAG